MAARAFGPFVFDTATGSLPKHGYRFIGVVPAQNVAAQIESAPARTRWTPRAVGIAAALLLAAALV